jgi:hypothetical protein
MVVVEKVAGRRALSIIHIYGPADHNGFYVGFYSNLRGSGGVG